MDEDKKKKLKKIITELLYGDLSEVEGDEVYLKIQAMAKKPECLDYIYHSHDYYSDGILDIDSVVEKCFDHDPIEL